MRISGKANTLKNAGVRVKPPRSTQHIEPADDAPTINKMRGANKILMPEQKSSKTANEQDTTEDDTKGCTKEDSKENELDNIKPENSTTAKHQEC